MRGCSTRRSQAPSFPRFVLWGPGPKRGAQAGGAGAGGAGAGAQAGAAADRMAQRQRVTAFAGAMRSCRGRLDAHARAWRWRPRRNRSREGGRGAKFLTSRPVRASRPGSSGPRARPQTDIRVCRAVLRGTNGHQVYRTAFRVGRNVAPRKRVVAPAREGDARPLARRHRRMPSRGAGAREGTGRAQLIPPHQQRSPPPPSRAAPGRAVAQTGDAAAS